jgi:hypothetical protein
MDYILDFKLSPCDACWYFGFGVLHGVQVNLVDDVSGTTAGPIFTGHCRLDQWNGTHNGFRKVVY